MQENSRVVILRLHAYRDALRRLKSLGFGRVFSDNLADAVGVTASQVRRDLLVLGHHGNKRGGYGVDDLLEKITQALGKSKPQSVVVIGAGNIGKALMHYEGFGKEGIQIVAVFDNNPAKVNRKAKVPILPLTELESFVRRHDIRVGVVAVPETAAQQVLDLMVAAGMKGTLNFAPIRLKAPDDFIVSNVNIGLQLETALYFVYSSEKEMAEQIPV